MSSDKDLNKGNNPEVVEDKSDAKTVLPTRTSDKVSEAWSKKVGRKINFELLELEAADGRKQTQLINPETGSIVVAVNATGAEADKVLVEQAGTTFIDSAFDWYEVQGRNHANQKDKADTDVAVPADGPGPAIEAKKSKNAGDLAGDRE